MTLHRAELPPETKARVKITADQYVRFWSQELHGLCDKTELLDGIVYQMPADGPLTTYWNIALNYWLVRQTPSNFIVVPDKTLYLGEHWAPTPDFYILNDGADLARLRAADIALVIEVADSTLAYDLRGKAQAYARHGVREYWVIDPNARQVFVHVLQADGVYGEPRQAEFGDLIAARFIPGLTLRLADLPRIS